MHADDAPVILGEIVGVHGVRGWVKVFSWTRPVHNILTYPRWRLLPPSGEMCERRCLDAQARGKGLIACLEGINDRDAARRIMGARIAVARAALPPVAPGEYYWHDLIGSAVVNREGVLLGQVEDMLETGAHDVMVVSGERERLIPFVIGVSVLAVDAEASRITVDWHPED